MKDDSIKENTTEYKKEAVALVTEKGYAIKQAADVVCASEKNIRHWKLGKNLGIVVEGEYSKMWDSELYQTTFGLNYTFK